MIHLAGGFPAAAKSRERKLTEEFMRSGEGPCLP